MSCAVSILKPVDGQFEIVFHVNDHIKYVTHVNALFLKCAIKNITNSNECKHTYIFVILFFGLHDTVGCNNG